MPTDNLTLADVTTAIRDMKDELRDHIDVKFDGLPCGKKNGNPLTRIAILEQRVKENEKRMGIVEKIGGGIAALLTAAAAWFTARGGT
jgi:hypothetical protein